MLKELFQAKAREAASKAQEAEYKAKIPEVYLAEARLQEVIAKTKCPEPFLVAARTTALLDFETFTFCNLAIL